jgi:hypothetical protein
MTVLAALAQVVGLDAYPGASQYQDYMHELWAQQFLACNKITAISMHYDKYSYEFYPALFRV